MKEDRYIPIKDPLNELDIKMKDIANTLAQSIILESRKANIDKDKLTVMAGELSGVERCLALLRKFRDE